MRDNQKTKAELLQEVKTLRKRVTNLTKKKNALRFSDQKCYSLLKKSPDIVMIVDRNGAIQFINHTVRSIKEKEVIGKKVYDFISPEHHDTVRKDLKRIFQSGQNVSHEISGVGRHGALSWYQAQLGPVRQDGRIVAASIFTRDITERKRAEKFLRESEERYRAIFQGAAEGIIVADVETMDFKYVNPAIYKMLGYTEKELMRLNVRDIHPKEDLEYVISEFKAQAQGEKISSLNIPCLRKDGTIIYADINTSNIKIGGRQCNVGFFTDTTKRRKIEQQLLESQEKYRGLTESLSGLVYSADPETFVATYVNSAVERLYGYTVEQWLRKPNLWKNSIHSDDKERVLIEFAEAQKTLANTVIEYRIITKAKKVRWVKDHVSWEKDQEGKAISMNGVMYDITEVIKVRERLEERREQIAHAEKLASLGTLSVALAHQLGNSLTTIKIPIQNSLVELEKKSCQSTIIENLEVALRGVLGAESVIDKLSRFSRKSKKGIIGEVNLKAVGERVLNLLKGSALRARISLHLKGMDKLPSVYWDEKDLEQLFFALIMNAIKAADGKKTHQLIISGAVKRKQIELRFADNCGGIARKNLDKIFQPFFTTKPPGKGTGLGLYIVELIVSEAGGKVDVESIEAKGSTFIVTLPINKDRIS